MSRRHRRTWTTVREGEVQSSSGYRASIAKLDSSRGATVLANLLDWMTVPSGIEGFEPSYRVLVTRPGSEASVGVAVARSRRRAVQQLAAVERVLATGSRDEVQAELGLDF